MTVPTPKRRRTRMIVNADDFGLSPGVNAGVIAAHQNGILTSTTLLANAPHFDQAVELAGANPDLGVGLHLNLVRGRPLSPAKDIPLLVDSTGRLRPFRLRRLGGSFLSQAEAEYRRQFEKIIAAGIQPTHIDFEKHHAWQAPLYQLACRLARDYGVHAVRALREPVAWSIRRCGWPGLAGAVRGALLRSGVQLGGAGFGGLAHPDFFLGQAHIGNMTETVWCGLLAHPPVGVVEVMTHPGKAESDTGEMGESWLAERRQVELEALLSPRVGQAVEDSGVELIHFGGLVER